MTQTIFYDEASYITDQQLNEITKIMNKKSRSNFYQKHELALWLVLVIILATAFCAALDNTDIIWRLSTPLVRIMP